MKGISRSIFILVILAGIEIYVWQGLKTIIQDSSKVTKNAVTIAYFTFSFLTLFTFFMASFRGNIMFDYAIFKVIFLICFMLLLSKLFFIVFLLFDDIVRLFRWLFSAISAGSVSGNGISRLKFLSITGAVVGALPFAAMTYGIIKGAHDYKITRVPLKLKNLPQAFAGKTLIQISDLHTGSFWDKEAVKKGIQSLVDLKPDMVFFTGDLVNNKESELDDYKAIFSQIKAPLGVYSVLGNHDYGDYVTWDNDEEKAALLKAENLKQLIQTQKEMGWDLLLNENREIKIGEDSLMVVGIENYGTGGFVQHGNMPKAMEGVNPEKNILLLSHDPSHWKYQVIKEYNMVDAMFSGHTHGAQFGIETEKFKWSPIQLRYKEWAGLYKDKEQQLYVNRGFGYLGYPGRFGIRPEITLFTLEKA
jgi:predicted MPP superfamily phosphohydrolase